jgi:hypothetical protein
MPLVGYLILLNQSLTKIDIKFQLDFSTEPVAVVAYLLRIFLAYYRIGNVCVALPRSDVEPGFGAGSRANHRWFGESAGVECMAAPAAAALLLATETPCAMAAIARRLSPESGQSWLYFRHSRFARPMMPMF